MSDPEGRATLRHLLRGMTDGVFPVGRLDYAVSGLMLLTNDGELGDRISKSLARMVQVYWVKLKGRPSEETLQKVGHLAGARLRLLISPGSAATNAANPWYEVSLSEAPRDLLRRALFEAGHPVEKMKRVKLSFLDLGDLPEGLYRQLTPAEVAQLRRSVERASANTAMAPQVSGAPTFTPRFRDGGAKPRRKFWRPKTVQVKSAPAKYEPASVEPTKYEPPKYAPASSDSAKFGAPKSGPTNFGRPKFEPRKFGSGKPGGARPGSERFEPRKFGSGKSGPTKSGSAKFGSAKFGPRKSGPPTFRKDRP
jgi:pseudouridine synthase